MSMRVPVALRPHHHLVWSVFLLLAIPVGVKVAFHGDHNLHLPDDEWY